MQPVIDPQNNGGFGNPTSDPNLLTAPQMQQQQQQAAAAPAAQPPPTPSGVTIPQWVMQIIPVVALISGAMMLFAQQRADVGMLKTALAEIKVQQQVYVTKQIFDLKMSEYDKYQAQMNARFDKLEGLINGLYDRLPAKHDREK
jgi:hypothetical protein